MAEETNHTPLSKETSKISEGNSPDVSAGKSGKVKKVPHYLRASTGSCHDACKYGHPHKFKDKPTRPPRRRLSAPLADEIQIFVDKKVQKAVQSELELRSTKESPANIKSKKVIPSSRKSRVLDSSKIVKQEGRSSTKSPSPDAPKAVKKVVGSSGKSFLSDALKKTKQEVASAAKKEVSPKQMPVNPKATSGSLKPNVRGFSPDSSVRLSGRTTSDTRVSESSRTSRNAIIKSVGPRASTLSLRTSKVEVKKPLNSATVGKGLKHQNQRSKAFTNKDGKGSVVEQEPAGEKVEEKTLHMIETKEDDHPSTAPDADLLLHSPTPLSPESLNSSSRTSSLSFTSHEVDEQGDLDTEDSEEDDSISNGDSKASNSLKEKKKLTHNSEDQHNPESLNLKFRKGKVVDHQSETNSPRRLRFRQGRTLGNNQGANDGAQRKSYRKKAAEHIKKEEETSVVKVVLKHQEMEAKKDEQVSLNNVIEETANKLVEKKRSKVKALVGAFETVISLQEGKPSAAER